MNVTEPEKLEVTDLSDTTKRLTKIVSFIE